MVESHRVVFPRWIAWVAGWLTLIAAAIVVLTLYALMISVGMDPLQPVAVRATAAVSFGLSIAWTLYLGMTVARQSTR